MSITVIKIVATTNLTTGAVAYGTAVGLSVKQVVKRAIFSNFSGGVVTITVNIVPSGGGAATSNQIINNLALQAGQTYVSPELSGMALITGDQIFALASANGSVNMTVSGIQVS